MTSSATLEAASKRVLESFDATMHSLVSAGMPIELPCRARGSLREAIQHRVDKGDVGFDALTRR